MDASVKNFLEIKEWIKEASSRYHIEAYKEPEIIAVSKTQPAERIIPLLQYGHKAYGENRVQEAFAKWPGLKKGFANIELHLIGPLQTNKVKEAISLFDVIETLDREKLARALAAEVSKGNKCPELFIQVNTGEEEQKAGVVPKEADNFIRLCRDELKLPVTGLMCIPPVNKEPAMHFALLRKIAGQNGLKNLSMGMSADFETAAALGATHIRLGSAIFGEREKKEVNAQA